MFALETSTALKYLFEIVELSNQSSKTLCGKFRVRQEQTSPALGEEERKTKTKPLVLSPQIKVAPPWQCLENCQTCHDRSITTRYSWFFS